MCFAPAYAQPVDLSEAGWIIVVVWAGVIIGACLLAFLPVLIAWSRRIGRHDGIVVCALLWAFLAIGITGYAINQQDNWKKEETLRIKTGLYDARGDTGAPALPWRAWAGLTVAYFSLLVWPIVQRRSARSSA